MKIERINDSQMKFMLTKNDLEKRSLDISDLAYGSSKTQELFQDIIDTACKEFSFNMDDTPLMIDAVPTSKSSIMIILTKVSNPVTYQESENGFKKVSGGEDFLPLMPKEVNKDRNANSNDTDNKRILKNLCNRNLLFKFENFNDVCVVSNMLKKYDVKSSLYKLNGSYVLNVFVIDDKGQKTRNVECILAEYGQKVLADEKVMIAYLKEKAQEIIAKDAIKVLANF